jgi:hypothetical protein
VIPLLGIYLKECKPEYDRATCTPMFIAALLTIVKPWKQPRCPKTDECILKNMVYMHDRVLLNHNEKLNYVVCR